MKLKLNPEKRSSKLVVKLNRSNKLNGMSGYYNGRPIKYNWETSHMAQRTFAKDEVKYTDNGTDQEHCSICTHYVNPTTCEIVIGRIVPRGWCSKFNKEQGRENYSSGIPQRRS